MRRISLLAAVCLVSSGSFAWSSAAAGDDPPAKEDSTQIETPAGRVTVSPAPGQSVETALKAALQEWAQQNVPRWIAQLSDADFTRRQRAADALYAVGLPAVGPLEQAANGNDTEGALRALVILTQLLDSRDTDASNSAYEALHRLRQSSNSRVAMRVPKTLERIVGSKLEALGAGVYFDESDSTYRITLDQKWVGGDAGLERLTDLPAVTQLSIGDCDVTDAGMDHLSALEQLRRLHLMSRTISVDGLRKLEECPALEDLEVPAQLATDDGLQVIARMPHLKRLEFRSAIHFDGDGLRHLAGHPSLQSLSLYETGVTAENLAFLLDIPHLTSLETPQTAMTDEGMEVLGKLTQLTGLSISNTRVTDAALIHLRNLKSLDYLNLSDNSITDTSLGYLEVHRKLTWLPLWNTYITRQAAQNLIDRIPGLEIGTLDELLAAPLRADALHAVRSIQALHGKVAPSHKSIETSVWLGPEWTGTDSDLKRLSEIPTVSWIGIGYPATDTVIPHLEVLSSLKHVYLNDTQITEMGVERLQNALPRADIHVTPDEP